MRSTQPERPVVARRRDSKEYGQILLAVALTVGGGIILMILALALLPAVLGSLPALLGLSVIVLIAFSAVAYWLYKSDESSGSTEAHTHPRVR